MIRISKTTYALLLAIGLLPTFVCAQEKEQKMMLSGGPLLEMNTTGFIHAGFTDGVSSMKMGVSAGGFLHLDVSRHFAIQGEMAFQYRHSEFGWEHDNGCYRYWCVEIPIYAMYQYAFANRNRIYVGIGPYTNFGLDATFQTSNGKIDLYEKDKETGLPTMRDSESGFGIKAGYEWSCGLQLNVSFQASVTNLLDTNRDQVKMHPMAFGAGIAYRFGKKGAK